MNRFRCALTILACLFLAFLAKLRLSLRRERLTSPSARLSTRTAMLVPA
jgi:hypothetical protein